MTDIDRTTYGGSVRAGHAQWATVDAGLRAFMLGVYNKLALGLIVSAVAAWLTASLPPVRDLFFLTAPGGTVAGLTPLGWVLAFAPLGVLLAAGFALREPTSRAAPGLYWTIVALMGASLGVLVLAYTGAALVQAFLITAAAFGALSLVGYTTNKDLSGFGSFLIVGVVGLIIASIVNLFLKSPALLFAVNVIGVFVFAGLIAWDTQRLKLTYAQVAGRPDAMGVATSYGALSLFINFVNLFHFLLALTGQRRT